MTNLWQKDQSSVYQEQLFLCPNYFLNFFFQWSDVRPLSCYITKDESFMSEKKKTKHIAISMYDNFKRGIFLSDSVDQKPDSTSVHSYLDL